MALTQLRGFGAHTGRRYGSFAGKAPHPVDILTQLRAFGAHSGLRYGTFTGKTPGVVTPPAPVETGVTSSVRPFLLPPPLRAALRQRIINEDDLLLLLASCIDGNALRH